MVRRDEADTDGEQLAFPFASRCSSPAGASPASVSPGAPSSRPQTAVRLQSTEIVVGESAEVLAAQLALKMGEARDRIEKDDHVRARLVVCKRNGTVETFHLGPHGPPLNEEDLALIHGLWLDAVATLGLQIHHRDVVRTAIEELAGDLSPAARRLWDTAHF